MVANSDLQGVSGFGGEGGFEWGSGSLGVRTRWEGKASELNFERGVNGGVLGGVVEHVGEGLGQQAAIEAKQREGIGFGEAQRVVGEFAGQRGCCSVEDVADFAPVGARFDGIGFHARDFDEVFDDALQAPDGRVDFGGEGVEGVQSFEGSADEGDGRFEFVGNTVEEGAVEALGFGREFGAVFVLLKFLSLAVMLFESGFAGSDSGDEVSHGDGHDKKHGEHDGVLGVGDVEGEPWGDKEVVPDEGGSGGHGEDGAPVPAGAGQDDGQKKHQRGEHRSGVGQEEPAGGGEYEEDGESPAELGYHVHGDTILGVGEGGGIGGHRFAKFRPADRFQ